MKVQQCSIVNRETAETQQAINSFFLQNIGQPIYNNMKCGYKSSGYVGTYNSKNITITRAIPVDDYETMLIDDQMIIGSVVYTFNDEDMFDIDYTEKQFCVGIVLARDDTRACLLEFDKQVSKTPTPVSMFTSTAVVSMPQFTIVASRVLLEARNGNRFYGFPFYDKYYAVRIYKSKQRNQFRAGDVIRFTSKSSQHFLCILVGFVLYKDVWYILVRKIDEKLTQMKLTIHGVVQQLEPFTKNIFQSFQQSTSPKSTYHSSSNTSGLSTNDNDRLQTSFLIYAYDSQISIHHFSELDNNEVYVRKHRCLMTLDCLRYICSDSFALATSCIAAEKANSTSQMSKSSSLLTHHQNTTKTVFEDHQCQTNISVDPTSLPNNHTLIEDDVSCRSKSASSNPNYTSHYIRQDFSLQHQDIPLVENGSCQANRTASNNVGTFDDPSESRDRDRNDTISTNGGERQDSNQESLNSLMQQKQQYHHIESSERQSNQSIRKKRSSSTRRSFRSNPTTAANSSTLPQSLKSSTNTSATGIIDNNNATTLPHHEKSTKSQICSASSSSMPITIDEESESDVRPSSHLIDVRRSSSIQVQSPMSSSSSSQILEPRRRSKSTRSASTVQFEYQPMLNVLSIIHNLSRAVKQLSEDLRDTRELMNLRFTHNDLSNAEIYQHISNVEQKTSNLFRTLTDQIIQEESSTRVVVDEMQSRVQSIHTLLQSNMKRQHKKRRRDSEERVDSSAIKSSIYGNEMIASDEDEDIEEEEDNEEVDEEECDMNDHESTNDYHLSSHTTRHNRSKKTNRLAKSAVSNPVMNRDVSEGRPDPFYEARHHQTRYLTRSRSRSQERRVNSCDTSVVKRFQYQHTK